MGTEMDLEQHIEKVDWMKNRVFPLLLMICLFCTACGRGPAASGNVPYTAGKGSLCNVQLAELGEKKQIFKLAAGDTLNFDCSQVQGSVSLKLTDDNGGLLYESESPELPQREGTPVSIEAEHDGTYQLTIRVLEAGGALSVQIG